MAKKGTKTAVSENDGSESQDGTKRNRKDYTFYILKPDGTREDVGLTLHSPTDSGSFQKWLQARLEAEGTEGKVVTGVFTYANV